MARRSENRGFASKDPDRRCRIASEGGRASHGRRGRDYEDDYEEDYDEDYGEDEGQQVGNRRWGEDWDDGYGDEDEYENTGYGEGEDEYQDNKDDRRGRIYSSRGTESSGRRGSSRRG